MPISSGERLGPYLVGEPLGEGGMGVVFRATDTRLGREVAIKVLRGERALDEKRIKRFEQEAKAAGKLAHPGIVTVLDVGEHEGAPFVVTELCRGETLRQALERGALPPARVVDLGMQISDALAAAHERGIVHRDLKPENVMVLPDGRIKVLDFGIAKLLDDPAADTGASTASLATETGAVLGTAGFMAPEQIAGSAVDARADVFALGAILFELLSGSPAFPGKSSIERMAAILKEAPVPLPTPRDDEPAGLRAIIIRCLEKPVDARFASASELHAALSGVRSVEPAAATSRRALLASSALALAAAFGAGGYAIGRARRAKEVGQDAEQPAPPPSASVSPRPIAEPPSYRALSFRQGPIPSARFVPDGNSVVYGARFGSDRLQLHSMRLDSAATTPMDLPSADVLSISRDGELAISIDRRVGFWPGRGTLARVSLGGGVPREVAPEVDCAEFGPDGETLIVVHRAGNKCRLEYPFDKVLFETSGWIGDVRLSPKKDAIAFIHHPFVLGDDGVIMIVDFNGKSKTLTGEWITVQGLAWSPSGDEVWFSGAASGEVFDFAIRAVDRDGNARVLLRAARRLHLHDVRPDGALLVTEDDVRTVSEFHHPNGKVVDLSWLDSTILVSVSRDGKWAILSEQSHADKLSYEVQLRATDGSPPKRLGEGVGWEISPDGKFVAAAQIGTRPDLVLLPTGFGDKRLLSQPGYAYRQCHWFPDGKRLLVLASVGDRPTRWWVYTVADASFVAVSEEGDFEEGFVVGDGESFVTLDMTRTLRVHPAAGGAPLATYRLDPLDTLGGPARNGDVYLFARWSVPSRVEVLDLKTGKRRPFLELNAVDPTGLAEFLRFWGTPSDAGFGVTSFWMRSILFLVTGVG